MRRKVTLIASLALLASVLSLTAQTPAARQTAPAQTPPTQTAPTQTASGSPQQIHTDMNRLMRGVLYPAANVVFSAQADDPAKVPLPPGVDPSMATDPRVSTFGGWQAIENAALALAESANLVMMDGRRCSTGVVAPINDPTWASWVQRMRDASMKSFRAAQKKDQDEMIMLAEELSNTCSGCHRRFRDRRPPAVRCQG